MYDLVISINVHENYPFLLRQLENIKNNVSLNYCIILNCNKYMFNECINLPENVYINPEIIEKRRFHGSIAHGIYSNMCYAINNLKFEYFVCCSSRNFFENNMTIDKLNHLNYATTPQTMDYNIWHWPAFKNSLLYKYINFKNVIMCGVAHEGLLFKFSDVVNIKDFLENNQDIRIDTFNYHCCVEEFALNAIAVYKGGGYYLIGNGSHGVDNVRSYDSDTKFMYKVPRS